MDFEESDIESFKSESEDETEDATKTKKIHRNNVKALEERLSDIIYSGEWVERLDMVCKMDDLSVPVPDGEQSKDGKASTLLSKGTVHDDFKREMHFYCQAQVAAKEAMEKLNNLGLPTERPDDYFAEMIKTDAHMHKIREKLANEKQNRENAEKAKKIRRMKQFGKKVQQEVLQKRQQERKQMLEAVDRIKKGKDKLKGDGSDLFDIKTDNTKVRPEKSLKRKRKDAKFGFGGKKKQAKMNSSKSSGDMSGFKPSVHSKAPRNKNKGKPKRMGKSRRNQVKSKKR
ncbi:probable rRNA-processing protein EBP2 isoform X1 [Rhopilema esculentum]|uniref:probable rRNA-processing protein EBP2 isoform X1 n=2 Tax=Rhopilema esculentum TaxID=499914 RepID=UPI0031D10F41